MIAALTLSAVLAAMPAVAQRVDDACFVAAEKKFSLPSGILRAIAKVESNFNPRAVNKSNANGTVDLGMMQINSIHLPRLAAAGWRAEDFWNPCKSIEAGAEILRAGIDAGGSLLAGLSRYNTGQSSSPVGMQYAQKVLAAAGSPGAGDLGVNVAAVASRSARVRVTIASVSPAGSSLTPSGAGWEVRRF